MPTLHHPAPELLQTGDLLFPKAAASASPFVWLNVRKRFDLPDPDLDRSLRDYLVEFKGEEVVHALENDAWRLDVSALLAPPRLPSTSASLFSTELSKAAQRLSTLGPLQGGWSDRAFARGQDLYVLGGELTRLAAQQSNPTSKVDRTMLLLTILIKAFPLLLHVWLNMSVNAFLAHPLCKLLIGALERESGPGFFVGHVALVLRERNGTHARDGRVWVIEANATDFSHYRVSLHPYLVEGEPVGVPQADDAVPARLRGWANRRLVLGEGIWHSRHHALLADDTDPGALDLRQRLVGVAKSYLGRPYGFFDDPTFGDDGRFYCGEFVHRVFDDVGRGRLKVDEHRTWSWLYTNRALMGDADFVAELEVALSTGNLLADMHGKPFFLLTLPMLYSSRTLVKQDGPHTPPYL